MSSSGSDSNGGVELQQDDEIVHENVWPVLKRHALGEQFIGEPPVKGVCPVCMEDLDIAGLPCSNDKRLLCEIMHCGHVICKICLDSLIDQQDEEHRVRKCPTCRQLLECRQCTEPIATANAPRRPMSLGQIRRVPPTKLEGGVFDEYCPECRAERTFIEEIRAGIYPPGLYDTQAGFIVFVYKLIDDMSRANVELTRENIHQAMDDVFHDDFDDLFQRRQLRIHELIQAQGPSWFDDVPEDSDGTESMQTSEGETSESEEMEIAEDESSESEEIDIDEDVSGMSTPEVNETPDNGSVNTSVGGESQEAPQRSVNHALWHAEEWGRAFSTAPLWERSPGGGVIYRPREQTPSGEEEGQ
ncbi:Fc.00g107410.m01.CDS01 [Cosmosporella sp. VM-42]